MDLDEVPPPPAVRAPTLPSLAEAEGYPPHGTAPPAPCCSPSPELWGRGLTPHPALPDSDFGEPRTQKGLDRYLDSLFDPVLSYGNGVSAVSPCPRRSGVGGVGHGAASAGGLCLNFPHSQELEKPAALVQRMKGGGGTGGGDGGGDAKQGRPAAPAEPRQPRGELWGLSLAPCLSFPT